MSIAALMVAGAVLAPADPAAPCDPLAESRTFADGGSRTVTAGDLVGLRDIGPVSNSDARAPILSLSPDGRKIAFQVRRADAGANTYCLGMYVLDLDRPGSAIEVDRGGEFIPASFGAMGFAVSTPPGMPATVTPKWSPDGQSIAYLRRDHGVTQAWRAKADGEGAEPLTALGFDVEDVSWSLDGTSLVVTGRPGLAEARAAIAAEGRRGYLYDDRAMPVVAVVPQPRDPIPLQTLIVRLADKRLRPVVTQGTGGSGDLADAAAAPPGAVVTARGPDGAIAWTARIDADVVTSPLDLHVKWPGGSETTCRLPDCLGVVSLWWQDDRTLVYLRHRASESASGLYRWRAGSVLPKAVLTTEDVLLGCVLAGPRLVCGREGSLQPRRLVALHLETGKQTILFDPNPQFAPIRLGSVERLHWTMAGGVSSFGDLVLPPDYRAGSRLPLIVVQYATRGFLRGGTGDEFPIQLFAAHGYAVLSLERPLDAGSLKGARTWDELNQLNIQNWADRETVNASLLAGVRMVIDRGIADPARIGLTGLSDGASTVQYALIHDHLFAAAAVGTCCDEAFGVDVLNGPVGSQWLRSLGFPGLTGDIASFWQPQSYRLNAAAVDTPLLMQLPDREYLAALESYSALSERHKPVELYVFPDEYHIKWQPAHRLADFNRSLDWFDYWLKDFKDPDPAKAAQYARWDALRAASVTNTSASPGK